MTVDQKKIDQWLKEGRKLFDSSGQPITLKPETPDEIPKEPAKKEESELDYLRIMTELLARNHALLERSLNKKPERVEPPNVVVQPPEVIVNTPPTPQTKPFSKWHFKLKKNVQGQTTDITATAITNDI